MTESSVDSGNGKLILRRAYCHIATGNGAVINPRTQELQWPRFPWSFAEEMAVNKILVSAYVEIQWQL